MNATEFIKSRLSSISEQIPKIGLRYAFDNTTSFHIVEIYPESIRRGNDFYMELECKLWNDFHSLFPEEDLLISEVDATNDMDNLIFEKIPSTVIESPKIDKDSLFSTTFFAISPVHKESISDSSVYTPICMNLNEAA